MSTPARPPPDDWRVSSSSEEGEPEAKVPRAAEGPFAGYAAELEAILREVDAAPTDLPAGLLRFHAAWHPFFHSLLRRNCCPPLHRVLDECPAEMARRQLPLFFVPTAQVRRLVLRERPGCPGPPPPASLRLGVYRGWLTGVRPPRTAAYAAQWKRLWEEVFDHLFARHPGADHPRLQMLMAGKLGPARRGGRVEYLPLTGGADDDDREEGAAGPQ